MILKFFAIFIFVKYMSSFYKILLLITLSVFSTLNLSAEDDFRQNTTTKNLTQQQLNILNNTLVKNGVKNTQFEELLTKICTDENAALLNKITQPTWSTKLTKLSNDLANAPPAFKNKIIQTPQLVEAWEVLDDALVDDLIRKNIDEVEFVDDFINNNPNKTKTQITSDINTQGYNAWKLVNAGGDVAKLTSILQKSEFTSIFNKLKNLPTTPNRAIRYASINAFRDEFIRLHSLNSTGVKSLDKVLDDFDNLVSNYSNITNIEKYVDELMQTPTKFKGGAYGLEILNNLSQTNLNGKTLVKFEASIDDLADASTGCRFDLQFSDGTQMIFVETKNYASSTSFTSSFYNQFKAYISNPNVTNIDQIKYFFRANPNITKAERVQKFKNMLLNGDKYEEIYNVNQTLMNSLGLSESNYLKALLESDNVNHQFFNFIEIF